MKKYFLSIGLACFLLVGCKKEQPSVLDACIPNVSLEDFKNFIDEANANNNLVVSAEEKPNEFEIIFEDDTKFCLSKEMISAIQENAQNWSITFDFSDGSGTSAGFIGDELIVPSDSIHLNPFGIAPLSAKVNFQTLVEGKISVRVVGQDGGDSDITHDFDYFGKDHSIEVYGLYLDELNSVEIKFTDQNGRERVKKNIFIQTDPYPAELPRFEILQQYDDQQKNKVFLYNYRTPDIPFMIDRFGKVRWYSIGFTDIRKRGLQRLENGNICFGAEAESVIYEYSMLGEKVNEWDIPDPYYKIHHDVIELPNGNFVVTVNNADVSTVEDYIIELDRNTGELANTWNLNDVLPKRFTFMNWINDWLHVNSVFYDESDNSLVISGRHQGIFKVNWQNELKWILAPLVGWESYESFLLQPEYGIEEFEWTWGQHSAMVMPNGNVFVFDNGFGREFGTADNYSRAVEYKISEGVVGGQVEQVWSYGKSRGEDFFSPIISDVDYLEESDTRFIVSGALAYEHTYVDSSNTSLNLTWDNPKCRIIEIDNNKNVLYEMIIEADINTSTVYRAEKLSIYP